MSCNRRSPFILVWISVTAVLALSGCQRPESWQGGLVFDRVLTIVLENADYKDAMKDPYLRDLASRGTLFSNFQGVAHPSYPNYLAMVGGRRYWTWWDRQKNLDGKTVADLLEARGLTWKNYAAGYPGNCFLGSSSGRYVRKHVPFLSFKSIQRDPARCARVVPDADFDSDVAARTVPNYAFYSPDMDEDGHDTGLAYASAWLKGRLEPLLANAELMARTLVVVTFDEADGILGNHIYTVFLGPMVKAGHVEKSAFDHYDVLRTIEENFGLGTLGGMDELGAPILDIWTHEAIDAVR